MQKEHLLFIKFLKWIHIIGIFGYLLSFILSFISQEYIFIEPYSEMGLTSVPIIYLITILGFLVSCLIVYGIKYKKPIGYYASQFYVIGALVANFVSVIIYLSWLIAIVIIPIAFHVFLGYILYKEKSYFGIKM